MSDTIIIRRNGEKFAVDCSTVLEAFNGHLKVKFDGIICPKCGASDSCWIPVRKVEDDGDRLRREVAELERKVSELRECLKEAVTEVCNRLEKCGFKEPCVFKTCYVQKWRKALKGASND